MRQASKAIAVAAVITIVGANSWRAFGGPAELFAVLIIAAFALVAVEYRNIPSNLRRAALTLFFLSFFLLPFARAPLQALQRGVFIAGLLLALVASVTLIARCALRSRQIQLIGESLRNRAPDKRYFTFNVAGQLFSAMLGFAGTNISLVIAAPADEPKGSERTDRIIAVTRGFSAATFWSPMFGNMAILLALYPTLEWVEVFPLGLVVAQFTVIVGVLLDRFSRRGLQTQAARSTLNSSPGLVGTVVPLVLVMLTFLGVVLAASTHLNISITPAIVLLAPLVALVLNIAMGEAGRRLPDALDKMRDDISRFPALASEAIIFLAAGCAGSILADAFPLHWAQLIGQALHQTPLFAVGFLMAWIMLVALIGIHPVLSAVFLASTITPQILGLPPVVHMLAILTGWGLSASLTPFSVVSLMASRYSGSSLYYISIIRNHKFVLLSALLICATLSIAALMMR